MGDLNSEGIAHLVSVVVAWEHFRRAGSQIACEETRTVEVLWLAAYELLPAVLSPQESVDTQKSPVDTQLPIAKRLEERQSQHFENVTRIFP